MSVICPKCAGSGTNPKSGQRCHLCGGAGTASWARARTTDPATSHAAAASVQGKLRETQDAVLRVLRITGPVSDEQLLAAYDSVRRHHGDTFPAQSPSGLRTRRRELVALGYVADSGRRVTTYSGRASIVWHATPHDRSPA